VWDNFEKGCHGAISKEVAPLGAELCGRGRWARAASVGGSTALRAGES
jgi:hypothetical protein